jgi:hypothetical protein
VKIIKFGILDPQYSCCAPLVEQKNLIRIGLLRRTIAAWGESPGGCHRIASCLMDDLSGAGDERRCRWEWIIADCRRNKRAVCVTVRVGVV